MFPISDLARKYTLGDPLLEQTELASAGLFCSRLHDHYMTVSNREGAEREVSIPVFFKPEHFLQEAGDCMVGFEDMFLLFNLRELDTSLLRCFTL
jgi:hypothetical protein